MKNLSWFVLAALGIGGVPAHAQDIYFLDIGARKIMKIQADGSGLEAVVSTTNPDAGPTIDPIDGKLYWADNNAHVYMANLDGSSIEEIKSTGISSCIVDLAVDVEGRKLYWVEACARKIQRADLDGSNITDIVTTGMSVPVSLAVDSRIDAVFWSDFGTNDIRRARLDGTEITIIVDFPVVIEPHGLALDPRGQKIYWGDSGKIQRAGFDGSEVEDFLSLPSTANEVWGLAIDPIFQKLYWAADGSDPVLGRSNLDGSEVEDFVVGIGSQREVAIFTGDLDIPATSSWALTVLALVLLGMGIRIIRQRTA